MKPTHGQCDQYMAEGQPCSGYRRLEADLAAARAMLTAITGWLEREAPEVFRRGLWDAIDAALAGEGKE